MNFKPLNFHIEVKQKKHLTLANHLDNRAAEIFPGLCSQTPPLSLTQTVTAYQFLVPYDIVLSQPKSFEVGHFKANIEIKWPALNLSGCGKTIS